MTRAARRLRVSQPSLSRAISELEAEVGCRLFDRHPRGVSVTAAGERYLRCARRVLEATEELDALVLELRNEDRASLTWGFPGLLPMPAAPALYAALVDEIERVHISFVELGLPTRVMSAWIGAADAVLAYSLFPEEGVGMLPLRTERRSLLVTRGHPLADRAEVRLEDVLDEVFCGSHPTLEPRRERFLTLDDHRGGPARRSHHRPLTVADRLAVVASGRAASVVEESAAEGLAGSIPHLSALPIVDADPGEMLLAWRIGNENPALQRLLDLARERPVADAAAA